MRAQGKNEGFTLIELLVVMALLGLVVALVVVNIDRDEGQLAELEAKRFQALVEHARDESTLTGRPYGIEVDEASHSYRFLKPGEPWQVIENDDLLRPRHLPEGVSLRLDVREAGSSAHILIVDGLGVITPFILTVAGGNKRFVVTVDAAQNVRLESNAAS